MKKIKLDVVLFQKVNPHFCFEVHLCSPFVFTTFPAFYHSTSLSHDSFIKNKDRQQNSINCVNDGEVRKVST